MRAIALNSFGGLEQLTLMELPVPVPGPDEVLIRIKAAGVNPVDYKIREGYLKDAIPHRFPVIPGWDASGIVEKVGSQATRFAPGEAVYAYCRKALVCGGTYAEYVAVPEECVARKPARLSFEEAASVPLAALTAYQALFDAGKLCRGQSVAILGATGGVGGFAVQLAHNAGAQVIAVAGKQNREYALSLGASAYVDYSSEDVAASVQHHVPGGVDLAFDCVGGEAKQKSAALIRRGGRLVSILRNEPTPDLKEKQLSYEGVFVAPNAAQLELIRQQIDEGRLHTTISRIFPLEEAAHAQELMQSGHTRGKIVLQIDCVAGSPFTPSVR